MASHQGLDVAECPYCHQLYRRKDRTRDSGEGNADPASAAGFVSPEYFRMLQDSLPGSTNSSAPSSPRRRLVEPVRLEQSSKNSPRSTEYIRDAAPTPPSPTGISASAFSPGYFQRFFKIQKELGRGGKGVVFLVTHFLDDVDLVGYLFTVSYSFKVISRVVRHLQGVVRFFGSKCDENTLDPIQKAGTPGFDTTREEHAKG